MDYKQRSEFWDKLLALEGKDKNADQIELNKSIFLPRYLYRYRPVTMRSLDALRTNKLYFSTANYYDDPFDTFIHVDLAGLQRIMEQVNSGTINEEQIFQYAKTVLANLFGTEVQDDALLGSIKQLITNLSNAEFRNQTMNFFRNIRNEIKKDIWTVCFSENGFNETLWLKYAQQHKGFAIQYDMNKPENILCGTYEKCKACGVPQAGTPLYPVMYSDTHYNGTRFAQFIVACTYMGIIPGSPIYSVLDSAMGGMSWERERISLIKKKCHEYDEEWRLILNGSMKEPVMREWRPEAVILGLNMETAERNLVISSAREAGVGKIYQSYIDDSGLLTAGRIDIH